MRKLVRSGNFKRQYKLMGKRGKNLSAIGHIIGLLAFDQALPTSCRDHALVGNYAGFRDCHIEPDWLLIYAKALDTDGVESLYLEATGSHADLF